MSACLTVGHLQEFNALWFEVQEVRLQREAQDRVTWKLTASGEYDSASAYRAQFLGSVKFDLRWLIWKPWAPTKCKFFAWLIIRNRVWLRTGLLREICHEMRYALCAEADRNQRIISSLLVATPSVFGA